MNHLHQGIEVLLPHVGNNHTLSHFEDCKIEH